MDTLETLTHNMIVTFVLFAILFAFKLVSGLLFKSIADDPNSQDFSYKWKTSLIIALMSVGYYAQQFISTIYSENGPEDEILGPAVISCIFIGVWLVYISMGGTAGGQKTTTLVVGRLFEMIVGTMDSGINWFDPIFERLTPLINLKDLPLVIASTPDLQTAQRGIKAKVKEIGITRKVQGNIKRLLVIEGGFEAIKELEHHFINEFFLHAIGRLTPLQLDQDKEHTIHDLCCGLKFALNQWYLDENYPFEIVGNILIGDTDLDIAYYNALAEKAIRLLKEQAENVTADALKVRVKDMGEYLMPGGTEAEQNNAARVTLGIVKEAINTNRYSLDADARLLAIEIAKILKGITT